jgi:hypothetical protein
MRVDPSGASNRSALCFHIRFWMHKSEDKQPSTLEKLLGTLNALIDLPFG